MVTRLLRAFCPALVVTVIGVKMPTRRFTCITLVQSV